MNTFFRKLAWLAHRRDKEAELRAELEFHLGEESEERMSEGRSPAEARPTRVASFFPVYGGWPVRIWQRIPPRANTSARSSTRPTSPRTCSGGA